MTENVGRTPPDTPPASMIDVVQRFFREQHWPYQKVGDQLYRIEVKGGETEWICLVKTDEEQQFCLVYSVLPVVVPTNKRMDMAAILININYDLGVGGFEMDLEDGEVRFRTSLDVEGDRLSPALFERLISMNIATMDKYIDMLLEEIKG